MKFTPSHIARSKVAKLNPGITKTKVKKAPSKEMRAIREQLVTFDMECKTIPWSMSLEEEYRFHPERKWRFDFAIPELKIAVEYEGIMSEKSRHTTITGFSGDTEKYNAAAILGWKVLRYTPLTYTNLLNDLKKIML